MLVSVVGIVTSAWGAYFIGESIIDGSISKKLIKPYSLTGDFIVNNIGEKIYKVLLGIVAIFLISLFLNNNLLLTTNISIFTILIFLISIILACLIAFFFDTIIGLATFWTHENYFIRGNFAVISRLFSGRVIPLVFFPEFLQAVAIILPFRYMLSFPVEVILGKLSTYDLILGFCLQFIWLFIAYIGYKLLFTKGVKIYQAYGS